jgi:hypothetical protein
VKQDAQNWILETIDPKFLFKVEVGQVELFTQTYLQGPITLQICLNNNKKI